MSEQNMDKAKGRVKEAAGALTDRDDLRNEGKADQAAGTVKEAVDKIADKAKDMINKARH
ncbi:MAG: CsbD family protein [Thermoleophilia bacterium]|nr:CsbD family protein [Thermoleophilia bacterium]